MKDKFNGERGDRPKMHRGVQPKNPSKVREFSAISKNPSKMKEFITEEGRVV